MENIASKISEMCPLNYIFVNTSKILLQGDLEHKCIFFFVKGKQWHLKLTSLIVYVEAYIIIKKKKNFWKIFLKVILWLIKLEFEIYMKGK